MTIIVLLTPITTASIGRSELHCCEVAFIEYITDGLNCFLVAHLDFSDPFIVSTLRLMQNISNSHLLLSVVRLLTFFNFCKNHIPMK